MTTISITLLATPESIVFKDSGDTYGVKRNDTDVIVVPKNTALTLISGFTYAHTFEDPAYDLEYSYSICVETSTDVFEYTVSTIDGPGLVESNLSWISRLDADLYFKDRLFITAWEGAADRDKEKALSMGTTILTKLALYSFVTIPQALKNAICEIALALLDGIDPEKEFENLALTSSNYAGVRSTYDRTYPMEHLEAGVPSIAAWRLISPYLDVPKGLKLSRVS